MSQHRQRLFIVEDEERIRHNLLLFFEDYEDELEVRTAATAEEALERLREEQADICLVDMRLPGINGNEFIRIAGEMGYCEHYLLHTGSIDLLDPETLAEIGLTSDDAFIKPCDLHEILHRIRQLRQQSES
ncbi:response regulator [Solidesulfovibrio magneticus]|uniref:Response regulator receiver protein n=1 Tax=Solidesulfovibrio magneticus (strain ATCC 700980 / DSM 13731 / RS-1) TaxID=573370 RepID=C4XTH9_SOLM1|nr:response regulator [Solidesulfovibrio magneticus]BAH75976.1 response regulator receiver protein [Solidesulfovibrio magneticus RS-1]